MLYGNARVQTNLTIRQGWRYSVLGVQNKTAGTGAWDIVLGADPAVERRARIEVEDVSLYVRTFRPAERVPRGVKSIRLNQWWSSTRIATNGEDIDVSLPRGSWMLVVGFLDSARGTRIAASNTDFAITSDRGYTAADSAVTTLSRLHYEINGVAIPTPQYSELAFKAAADATSLSGADNDRAYAAYLEASTQARAAAGVVMTRDAFERSPVFPALIPKTLRDQTQHASIRYTCPTIGAGNSMIFIMALYSQSLDVEYDDMANPVSTTLSTTIGPMED